MGTESVGTKIFFAGGWGGDTYGNRESVIDIYDLSTLTWSTALYERAEDVFVICCDNS